MERALTNPSPADNFACPICGAGLSFGMTGDASRACSQSHSFDKARNYLNLLLVQHKASRDPGDTPEMVKSRQRLLDSGVYQNVSDALNHAVIPLAAAHPFAFPAFCIVDAGCGDGYYTSRLADALADKTTPITLAGTDISKHAVRIAAKRKGPVAWAVANNRHLPFVTGSVDLILCLFGFPVWEGFRDVQAVGGRVLMVDPGPDHLVELRSIIYRSVKRNNVSSLSRAEAAGYVLEHTTPLNYQAELTSQAKIADLLAMTPHAFRAPIEGRAALQALDRLTVTVDVVVRQLRLASGPPAS
jgi:23S rRNA (guanine745-N1)-methyltransferase